MSPEPRGKSLLDHLAIKIRRMNVGKEFRLSRIFKDDGRSVIIAMDHAYIYGPMKGLKNPGDVIQKTINGGADAIMTTYGIINRYYNLMKGKVATILRLDGGISKYQVKDLSKIKNWSLLYTVEEAVRLGVDGVIVMVFIGAPCENITLDILANVAEKCEKWGMPLAAEIIPTGELSTHDPEVISTAARIGAEYGADMIKTNYTGSVESFRKVVESCPIPVLIAGGPKMRSGREVLEMVKGMIDAGGKGVFFGRNIWQHKDPTAMTRAIVKIIHQNATIEEALKELFQEVV